MSKALTIKLMLKKKKNTNNFGYCIEKKKAVFFGLAIDSYNKVQRTKVDSLP